MIQCTYCRKLTIQVQALQKTNRIAMDRLRKLDALESAGVQDWEGYDTAMEILNEIGSARVEQKR